MPDRRHARILAMQSLCQLDVLADDFLPQLDRFLAEETPDRAVRDYARRLVHESWQRRDELDAAIQAVAEHWDVRRMTTVDRNVLRVAVCELLHRPEIPPPVAIDEAVEIGKTFSTADSAAFINGVLDAVLKRPSAPPPPADPQPDPGVPGRNSQSASPPDAAPAPDPAPESAASNPDDDCADTSAPLGPAGLGSKAPNAHTEI